MCFEHALPPDDDVRRDELYEPGATRLRHKPAKCTFSGRTVEGPFEIKVRAITRKRWAGPATGSGVSGGNGGPTPVAFASLSRSAGGAPRRPRCGHFHLRRDGFYREDAAALFLLRGTGNASTPALLVHGSGGREPFAAIVCQPAPQL